MNRTTTNDYASDDSDQEGRASPSPPVAAAAGPGPNVAAPPVQPVGAAAPPPKEVDYVLHSDIGLNTLLSRLKQSLASVRDYSAFLKKRSSVEEEHAQGLRRLVKATQESIHRPEARQGTYSSQLQDVMRVHERMADHGLQFAMSLHQMHEDLADLHTNMERGRKHWKHEGLNAEKRSADAEALMDKAKTKYDGLADEYERAKGGELKGSRRIGLKGPKSAQQYEEDLLRKVQAADADYQQKVHAAHGQREELVRTARPQAIRELLQLISECDAGLALQMQKFATFNEKLLVGNGLAVMPLAEAQRSMKDMVNAVDDKGDFHSYILGHASKVPVGGRPEIRYEPHPFMGGGTQQSQPRQQQPPQQQYPSAPSAAPQAQTPSPAPPPFSTQSQQQQYRHQRQASGVSFGGSTSSRQGSDSYAHPPPASMQQPPQIPPQPYQQQSQPQTDRFGAQVPYPATPQAPHAPSNGVGNQYSAPPASAYGAPVSATTNGPWDAMGGRQSRPMDGPPMQQQQPPPPPQNNVQMPGFPSQQQQQTATPPPPLRRVFGIKLDELFARDGTVVPMIVYQCMQAVDLFGLDVEGIYRINGTATHVQQMKAAFDHDSARVDFRNPAAFFHDVNSVAGLLKQFLRELPDPLLTTSRYGRFIDAARLEETKVRRDALHAIINDLPDAHYATLRVLVLHLNRVAGRAERNRMNANNLAICFAPSLMGAHQGAVMADAGLQARVIEAILENTLHIFDED